MSESRMKRDSLIISAGEAEILAAIYKATKEQPEKIVTLDKLHEVTGQEKGYISKVISTIKKQSREKEIIRSRRTGDIQGYGLNTDYICTSALTARILLELRKVTILNSIALTEFKEAILKAPFYKKAGGTAEIFDARIAWAAHPKIGYIEKLETIEGNIRTSQRVDDEASYLERIALL